MQKLYDFVFIQIETSIRELGYGDVSINKKMKNYINFFHSLIVKIDNWDQSKEVSKNQLFKELFDLNKDFTYLVQYFNDYAADLNKNNFQF